MLHFPAARPRDPGNGNPSVDLSSHLPQVGNTQSGTAGIQIQHQTAQVCHQEKGPLGLCSVCLGDIVGSVQPNLPFSSPPNFFSPTFQDREGGHSFDPHFTKLVQEDILKLLADTPATLPDCPDLLPQGSVFQPASWSMSLGTMASIVLPLKPIDFGI